MVKNADLQGQRAQPGRPGRSAGDERWAGAELRSFHTDLQNELVAGVSTVEFRTGDSELPVRHGSRSGVPVAHLPERLLVARHGVHALGNTPQWQNARIEILGRGIFIIM